MATVVVMDIKNVVTNAVTTLAHDEAPFDLDAAWFFVVSPAGESIVLGNHQDLYLGLEVLRDNIEAFNAMLPPRLLDEAMGLGVISCGWASPMDEYDGLPPSQSPNRRRCRIAAFMSSRLEFAAAAQFESDPDDIVISESPSDFGICLELRMTMEALLIHRHAQAIRSLETGEALEL